jgi:hypothetical protein
LVDEAPARERIDFTRRALLPRSKRSPRPSASTSRDEAHSLGRRGACERAHRLQTTSSAAQVDDAATERIDFKRRALLPRSTRTLDQAHRLHATSSAAPVNEAPAPKRIDFTRRGPRPWSTRRLRLSASTSRDEAHSLGRRGACERAHRLHATSSATPVSEAPATKRIDFTRRALLLKLTRRLRASASTSRDELYRPGQRGALDQAHRLHATSSAGAVDEASASTSRSQPHSCPGARFREQALRLARDEVGAGCAPEQRRWSPLFTRSVPAALRSSATGVRRSRPLTRLARGEVGAGCAPEQRRWSPLFATTHSPRPGWPSEATLAPRTDTNLLAATRTGAGHQRLRTRQLTSIRPDSSSQVGAFTSFASVCSCSPMAACRHRRPGDPVPPRSPGARAR